MPRGGRSLWAALVVSAPLVVLLAGCAGQVGGPAADDGQAPRDASPPGADRAASDADTDATEQTCLELTAPAAGAEVQNPVTIAWRADPEVRFVSLEVDGWSLHGDPLPAAPGSYEYTFTGVGHERELTATGLDAEQQPLCAVQVSFTVAAPELVFPIEDRPDLILSRFDDPASTASFGAGRADGRLHAGCDLYWTDDGGGAYEASYYSLNDNTPIFAVADGVIVDYYYFYQGTNALVVDHGDFTVRYGEVDDGGLPGGLAVGSAVKAGQKIAIMGDLDMSSGSWSMLHFELYSNDRSGPLTNTSTASYLHVPDGNYQRRADLLDCGPFLRAMRP